LIDPGDLCSDNRSVMGFNLIWWGGRRGLLSMRINVCHVVVVMVVWKCVNTCRLTDKVVELNAELDAMLEYEWRPPHVGSSFPFHQLPEALKALQSGQTVGKVVVLTKSA